MPKAGGTVLVGATQFPGRHDLEVEAGSIAHLLDFAFTVYPTLRRGRFVEAWAGLRPSLPDRLPAIGLTHLKGLWVAVGHHRDGILLSGWTGDRLAAAILEATPLPNAVSPARFFDTGDLNHDRLFPSRRRHRKTNSASGPKLELDRGLVSNRVNQSVSSTAGSPCGANGARFQGGLARGAAATPARGD